MDQIGGLIGGVMHFNIILAKYRNKAFIPPSIVEIPDHWAMPYCYSNVKKFGVNEVDYEIYRNYYCRLCELFMKYARYDY